MAILFFLEGIRNSILDALMMGITQLGGEAIMLLAALVMFWCVDKYWGYYLIGVSLLGTTLNQFMKLMFRVPRPWVLDPEFTIVEAARADAGGYSFPSGHSQSAVGTFGVIAVLARKRWVRILSVAAAVLVPVSRMYLGVHTPLDVLVGAGTAVFLVLLLRPVGEGKHMKPMLGAMVGAAVLFYAVVVLYPFPADMDPENLAHGVKNAADLLGAVMGIAVVWIVDEKYLHFRVKASLPMQIFKVVGGICLTFLVKSLLKAPLNALFSGALLAEVVRYFLVVLTAGLGWPWMFTCVLKKKEE